MFKFWGNLENILLRNSWIGDKGSHGLQMGLFFSFFLRYHPKIVPCALWTFSIGGQIKDNKSAIRKRVNFKKKVEKREVIDVKHIWDENGKSSRFANEEGIIGQKQMAALRET